MEWFRRVKINHTNMEYNNQNGRRENSVYQESVPAGKRKYFLDIRTTRDGDHYLTITERTKKRQGMDFESQRHTIYLYKEDFVKFENAFRNCAEKIREFIPNFDEVQFSMQENTEKGNE